MRANPRDLVGGHHHAKARPADQHAIIGLLGRYARGNLLRKIRVIHRVGRRRPLVIHLVPGTDQVVAHLLFQREPGVVSAQDESEFVWQPQTSTVHLTTNSKLCEPGKAGHSAQPDGLG